MVNSALTLSHTGIPHNLSSSYEEPVWGHLYIRPPDVAPQWQGKWVGNWAGQRIYDAATGTWMALLSDVSHGEGGDVYGYQGKCTEIITAYTPMPIVFQGHKTCRMLIPGARLIHKSA